MIFRPKGRDDCCCKSWKDKINELWEKYQGVVKGVKAGSVTAYPDGDGIADLDGAVADAIAQQVPPMLTDLVTENELSTALEDYPTETELSQTLEDYATQEDLETKQDVLVSGETIRTINGRDLLGEGNLQFNDILPDFSEAAEGDALVIGSEGLPEWGDVDPLPDTAEANAGDALVLDTNLKAIWSRIDTSGLVIAESDFASTPSYKINNVTYTGAEFYNMLLNGTIRYDKVLIVGKEKKNALLYIIKDESDTDYPFKVWGSLVEYPGIGSQLNLSVKQYRNVRLNTNGSTSNASASSNYRWASVPQYNATNAGQILSVNANGALEWITLS